MNGAPLLSVDRVSGGYGDIRVVRDISFAVETGKVVCVTGRNGVGKTTLMKLIAGYLPLMEGTVGFDGSTVTGLKPHQRSRLGFSYAPQESVAFPDLSVRENLTLHHADRSLERYNRLFEAFPRLAERLVQKAGTLSGGERKILSFTRALAEDKPLTLLDEPTEGVQSENIGKMSALIAGQAAKGRSFLVVEQNLTLIEDIADQVVVLDHGEIAFATERHQGMREHITKYIEL